MPWNTSLTSLISHNLCYPGMCQAQDWSSPICIRLTSHSAVTLDAAINQNILNFSILLSALLCLFQPRLPPLCCSIYLLNPTLEAERGMPQERGSSIRNDPEGLVVAGKWDQHSQGELVEERGLWQSICVEFCAGLGAKRRFLITGWTFRWR